MTIKKTTDYREEIGVGYTHSWTLNEFTEADAAGYDRALPTLRDIVKRHRPLLAFEYDRVHRVGVNRQIVTSPSLPPQIIG